MEEKRYDLLLEVLRRMRGRRILDKLILVGSWCILLYEDYFREKGILPPIRTRDLEFLIPIPPNFDQTTNLHELLRDLGFVVDYKGKEGYMILVHPDLILEFLVPARGRETKRPHPIAQLGVNAQALRFMDLLLRNPIQVLFNDMTVTVPHPASFALQKLLIARRRKQKGKAEKDRAQAIAVLRALDASDQLGAVRSLLETMPESWKRTIRKELIELGEKDLVDLIVKGRNPTI